MTYRSTLAPTFVRDGGPSLTSSALALDTTGAHERATSPSRPLVGPSSPPQRFYFVSVRIGVKPGVYTNWEDAEEQTLVGSSFASAK